MKVFELNVYNVETLKIISGIPNAIRFYLKDGHLMRNEEVNPAIGNAIYNVIKKKLCQISTTNDAGTIVLDEDIHIQSEKETQHTYRLVFTKKTLESGVESLTTSDIENFIDKYYAKMDID